MSGWKHFDLHRDDTGAWCWTQYDADGAVLARSCRAFATTAHCLADAQRVAGPSGLCEFWNREVQRWEGVTFADTVS